MRNGTDLVRRGMACLASKFNFGIFGQDGIYKYVRNYLNVVSVALLFNSGLKEPNLM